MPNWCSNSVTISGDKDQIDKFEAFLNEKNGKEWFDFCEQKIGRAELLKMHPEANASSLDEFFA